MDDQYPLWGPTGWRRPTLTTKKEPIKSLKKIPIKVFKKNIYKVSTWLGVMLHMRR